MHELLTAAEMAEADRRTIAGGVPGMTLMEAAGRAVAEGAAALAPEGPVVVVRRAGEQRRRRLRRGAAAGGGRARGAGGAARRSGAAPGRRARWRFERWPGAVLPAGAALPAAALVVDALFGAGLDRPLEGAAAALVAAMNRGAGAVLAVDLPSGVDADTGAVLGAAVRADADRHLLPQEARAPALSRARALRAAGGRRHRHRRRRAGGGRAAGVREPAGALGGAVRPPAPRTTSTGAGTRWSSRGRWRAPGRRGSRPAAALRARRRAGDAALAAATRWRSTPRI